MRCPSVLKLVACAATVVTRPPYRNALVVIAVAVTMGSLFAASFTLALSRPTPHHIPTGLVGDPSTRPALVPALEAATQGGLAFRRYGSAAATERAIGAQQIYAALVLASGRAQLLVASAAGAAVARVLEQAATQIAQSPAGSLSVVDLRPLPADDPQGLAAFYVTLAATVLGFVTVFQLRVHASPLSLRGWFACIVALAAVGGLLLALAIDPLIEALHGPFLELWPAIAAEIVAAALFSAMNLALVGPWAFVPTFGLLMVLGIPSSGGAVAVPLLPAFYGFIDRFLPPGATVATIRNAVYFQDAQHLEPMLVQATWIVCLCAALILAARLGGRTPSAA